MDSYYLVMLAFLGVIAIIDLFVGVSNDAVNFLNSALGCRIAKFRTTMWVATAGVLLGATFSSGMMEIARSGVFNPQMFSFAEIMVIFFAVMVADVILLDAFNTLGLPTSPTGRPSLKSPTTSTTPRRSRSFRAFWFPWWSPSFRAPSFSTSPA